MSKTKSLFTKIKTLPMWAKITSIIAIIALITGIVVAIVVLPQSQQDNGQADTTLNDTSLTAPAENTDDLTKNLDKVDAEIGDDAISFTSDIAVNTGEKVAIWLYSEPKFLGFFEIKEKDGVKYIEGLDAAIKKAGVEGGNHNIAIVTENGTPIGYIDIVINNGQMTNPTNTDGGDGGDQSENETGNNTGGNTNSGNSSNRGNSNSGGNNSGSNSGNSNSNTGGSSSGNANTPATPTTPKADYNLNDVLYYAEVTYWFLINKCGPEYYETMTAERKNECVHNDPTEIQVNAVKVALSEREAKQQITAYMQEQYQALYAVSQRGNHTWTGMLTPYICELYHLSCGGW